MLVLADWEPPGTFDPRPPTTETRLRDDTLVFGRLWIPDPEGRLLPDLAASVPRPAAGGLTVKLRAGLRWSDGTPLTSADVVSSCRLQCGGVEAVAVTPTEVRFETADPARLATLFVAPGDPSGRVASGPFRLVSADAAQLRFERNPYYRGHPPYLAAIVELLPPSHDAMVEMVQAGEVDYLPHLGPADISSHLGPLRTVVTESQREEVLVPTGIGAATLAAISAATDRQALVEQVYGGGGSALGLPRQPTLARHLLGGRGPQIALQTVCDDPLRSAEAALLAAQWTEVGVRVTTSCAAVAVLSAPASAPRVALYSVLAGEAPAGAVPLLRRPAVRAVSPGLRGFLPNDTAGTDLWNVADWWLQ